MKVCLVFEPDFDVRQLLGEILEHYGYRPELFDCENRTTERLLTDEAGAIADLAILSASKDPSRNWNWVEAYQKGRMRKMLLIFQDEESIPEGIVGSSCLIWSRPVSIDALFSLLEQNARECT